METPVHGLPQLFAQLGLASDTPAIDEFIAAHRPLANGMPLYRAAFWSPAQRDFLKSEILEDADWSAAVEELNLRLH